MNKTKKGLVIIPTILPLTLDTSIKVIRNLQELDSFEGVALQLNHSNQDLLSEAYSKRNKIGLKDIGYFCPIVNFATSRNKPTYAIGEKDFEDMNEAIEAYKSLSAFYDSIGDMAYVCSRENANFFRNIRTVN
tara:strand:- start:1228 stop:1626 length:399 start_codon:yes stop_codon:yes gene_type:complete